MKVTTRRGFIKSAGLTAVSTSLPYGVIYNTGSMEPEAQADALVNFCDHEKIQRHADEILRLLLKTSPEGFGNVETCSIVNGRVIASSFPLASAGKWKHGDPIANYQVGEGWVMEGGMV